jgi:hypothetical protein
MKNNPASEIFSISKDFINEGRLGQTGPKKKGGPYTAKDKTARRNEVYKLHFDYGYSSRKIAEMMKINRKTIDNDIRLMYSKILHKWDFPDIEQWLLYNMESLEIQKSRLREELDKASDLQYKISLERLLLDVESRNIDLKFKLCNSTQRVHRRSTDIVNMWLEKKGAKTRYVNYWDTVRTTPRGRQKIDDILRQEKPFLGKDDFQ